MNPISFRFAAAIFAAVISIFSSSLLAQGQSTDIGSKTSVPPQDSPTMDVAHDSSGYQSGFPTNTNRTTPILFIVGDSTVHNYSGGRVGWGDVIEKYFNTNRIRVENRALAGRSSRTFIMQGWWDKLLQSAKRGDFVLIQMGHNDGGPLDDTNRARGTIHGIGDDQKSIYNPVTHQDEMVYTYGWYMRKYIADAREHGMTPIICSPVPHLPKAAVKAVDIENSDYVRFAGMVATNESVTFINLNQIVLGHYAGMSPTDIRDKYFATGDSTHFNAAGAEVNARSVIEGLHESDCPLKAYLTNSIPGSQD